MVPYVDRKEGRYRRIIFPPIRTGITNSRGDDWNLPKSISEVAFAQLAARSMFLNQTNGIVKGLIHQRSIFLSDTIIELFLRLQGTKEQWFNAQQLGRNIG